MTRCCLDAITGVLVADDSEIIGLAVTKDYRRPGVHVQLTPASEAEVDWEPTWDARIHLPTQNAS